MASMGFMASGTRSGLAGFIESLPTFGQSSIGNIQNLIKNGPELAGMSSLINLMSKTESDNNNLESSKGTSESTKDVLTMDGVKG